MSRRALAPYTLALPVLLAAYIAVVVGTTWAMRIAYPFDLEWMEGGVLAHAWRVQSGAPIYAAPTPEFIPMVYTPGYYYVLATLGWVVGISHTLGRAVSIAGTLLACAALPFGAWRHGASPWLGVLGAGMYLGVYTHSGAFYDLVRADALAVGLLAWAVVLATDERRRLRDAAAITLFAAFVVKHNMAAVGIPLALGLWAWRGWREALRFGLLAAVPGLAFTLWMQWHTDGHFLRYIIDVPRSHPLVWERFVPGTVRETGGALPLTVAALTAWAIAWGPRHADRVPAWLYAVAAGIAGLGTALWIQGMPPVSGIPKPSTWEAFIAASAVGAVGTSFLLAFVGQLADKRLDGPWVMAASLTCTLGGVAALMRAHHGGFVNVFMPWDWLLSALFVVLLIDVSRTFGTARGPALAAILATAVLGHLATGLELDRLHPTEEDVVEGDRIVAALAEVRGPVLSAYNPWLAAQAGHEPGFHLIALWDIQRKGGPYVDDVPRITEAIRLGYFGAVLDSKRSMRFGVQTAYDVKSTFQADAMNPRTGWRAKPAVLRVPRTRPRP